MSGFARLLLAGGDAAALAVELERGWAAGEVLAVAAPQERTLLEMALPPRWPEGLASSSAPALVLGTGGSSGGRRWCLQPLEHLQRAARATGLWLEGIGLDPAGCELFSPLPLHHISGMMPLLRARCWGAALRWLAPPLLRDPQRLLVEASPAPGRAALLSLVPTQLQRLLDQPDGRDWLRRFALIWLGGAALTPTLAQRSREAGLRISPCYGSTETGAMVAALPPQRFLAGDNGCGKPLPHAQLRIEPASGALQIRSGSLAAGFLAAGVFEPLPLQEGWWCSGDAAALGSSGLQLLGRLDGALNSGGETVFPEQVRQRLLLAIAAAALPVRELLLLAEPDPLWGERLVALVRPAEGADVPELLERLAALARILPPSQRPGRWLMCGELSCNAAGKLEMARWQGWLLAQPAGPG